VASACACREYLFSNYKTILLIAVFAVVAMLPAYWFGLPSGNDQSQHYQFAWTVYNEVKAGDLYPSFGPNTNHGFGDYGLRFYPPLTYYVLAGLRVVTGDWYYASMAALTLVFFAGALGVYLWTRELFDERTGVIAAALYTFIPYHLNEVYNNYLLAEFFATAILPFSFLYLHRTMAQRSPRNAPLLAISTSLLVLTHLPLTILGGIAMGIYAVCLIDRERLGRQIALLGITGFFIAAMTAFYWSRWLPELAWITHTSAKYFSTTWDYRANFLLVPTHWTNLAEDVLNLWFADVMLLIAVLVALPALVMAFRPRGKWRPLLPLAITFALSALLTTPLTRPLWDRLGFLQTVQFPWRWLAVVSLFAAVLGGVGITRGFAASREKKLFAPAVVALTLTVLAFVAVLIVRSSVYVTHAQLDSEVLAADDSTGCDCWWPIWAKVNALGQQEKVATPGREVAIKTWSPDERVFVVSPGMSTAAIIKTWYYPRWQANVNGVPVETLPDANGALIIDIPADTADVSLRFVEPWYVFLAAVISLLTWAVVLFTTFALLLKSRGRRLARKTLLCVFSAASESSA